MNDEKIYKGILFCHILECCYMHIDKTVEAVAGHKAVLVSPFMKATAASCFSFAYIMHGEDIGSLKVYTVNYKGEVIEVIFEKHGNQGSKWLDFRKKVKADEDFEVRIIHRRDGKKEKESWGQTL